MSKFSINNPAFLSMAGNAKAIDAGTFYIEAIDDNTTVEFGYPSYTDISYDDINYINAPNSVKLNSGERVYIKLKTITTEQTDAMVFSVDSRYNAGGNLLTNEFYYMEDGVSVNYIGLDYSVQGSYIYDASKLVVTLLGDEFGANSLFNRCSVLKYPPKLPSKTLTEDCYKSMFIRCESLVIAPKLPASILAKGCYDSMFSGCSSLINSPELPATTLVRSCYTRMFEDCTKLSSVTCLATATEAGTEIDDCVPAWLRNVPDNGTFIKAAGIEWPTGESGIPEGWTVQDYAG